MSDKIIFPESEEAAALQRVMGWVSREGQFYGKDERTARWSGATHVHCEICGALTSKNWTICKTCREQRAHDRYLKFLVVRWDENVPVYSPVTDKYYWNRDDVRDEDHGGIFDPVPLQLVLCKPIYAPGIDPEAYYEDLLPEYNDLSDVSQNLVDAFQELNDFLNDARIILSYEPTDTAIV